MLVVCLAKNEVPSGLTQLEVVNLNIDNAATLNVQMGTNFSVLTNVRTFSAAQHGSADIEVAPSLCSNRQV